MADAGVSPERSPEDLREVGNYVAALEHGLKRLESLPLPLLLAREFHETLMTGGAATTPGQFPRPQNWIDRPGCSVTDASYVPPPSAALLDHLGRGEGLLHDESVPPLVHAALMHYHFEAIHPFIDGNGRIERLLITLSLCVRRVLAEPLLYLSTFSEATRNDSIYGEFGANPGASTAPIAAALIRYSAGRCREWDAKTGKV